MNDFEYSRPTTLSDAIALLAEEGAKAIAGGTDLVLQMREGETRPSRLVDITGVEGLDGIEKTADGGVRIGAATPLRALERHALLRERFPVIPEAAAQIGSVQIRNVGTVGGNLCNAAPSADMAPALMVLGATAVIAGPGGERTIALEDFFVGPGETVLRSGELLVALEVGAPAERSASCYQRITTRKAMDIAFVGVASALTLDGGKTCREARIALGAVAPTPIRAPQAEKLLLGSELDEQNIEAAASKAEEEARPISDLRSGAEYRREMVKVLTRRTLAQSLERALAEKRSER